MRHCSQLIFLRNVAPYEGIIGIILIRIASSALLMVAFCIYISTLNTYSTVGESQGKGKEAFEDSRARNLKFDDDLIPELHIVPIIPSICVTETSISFPSV